MGNLQRVCVCGGGILGPSFTQLPPLNRMAGGEGGDPPNSHCRHLGTTFPNFLSGLSHDSAIGNFSYRRRSTLWNRATLYSSFKNIFFCVPIFFGGLECVAHFVFMRDVWIRTHESCRSKQARYST